MSKDNTDTMEREYRLLSNIINTLLVKIKNEVEKTDTNYDHLESMIGMKGVLDGYRNSIGSSINRRRTMMGVGK